MTDIEQKPGALKLLPVWYHGWNVLVLVIALQALVVGFLATSFSFWVEPWTAHFDVSRSDVLLIATLYNLIVGASALVSGPAIDRFPARWLVTIGLGSLVAGCLLISVASEFWHIMAVYLLIMPIAFSLAGPVIAQSLAARWFPTKSGFAIGMSSLGTSLGGVIMPLVVTTVLVLGGWRMSHQVLALIAAFLIPVTWLILSRLPPVTEPRVIDSNTSTVSMRSIFGSSTFWLLVLMFLPIYFLMSGFQYNIAPYASDKGISPTIAAMMVSLMSAMMMLGKLIFGWLMDRFPHRRVFAFAASGVGVSMCVLTTVPPSLIIPAVAMLAFFTSSVLPVKGALVSSQFGVEYYGRALGLMTPFLMGAASVGPVTVGWARDQFGSYDPVFFVLGLLVLPVVLLPFWLRRVEPAG